MNSIENQTGLLENDNGAPLFHEQIIRTSLFHDTFLRIDIREVLKEKWDRNQLHFSHFRENLDNLIHSPTFSDRESWTHSDTWDHFFSTILELLSWGGEQNTLKNYCLVNEGFELSNKSGDIVYIRPQCISFDSPKSLKEFKEISDPLTRRTFLEKNAKFIMVTKPWNSEAIEKAHKKKEYISRYEYEKYGDTFSFLDSDAQLMKYLELTGVQWGIYSDGPNWKLYENNKSSENINRFVHFDLGKVLYFLESIDFLGEDDTSSAEEFLLYFYWLFSSESHTAGGIPFIQKALIDSERYSSGYQDKTKSAFLQAMHCFCNGMYKSWKKRNKGKNLSEKDLRQIRNAGESFIFNLLFIRSCENRGILPTYIPEYLKVSLHTLIRNIPKISSKLFEGLDYFVKDSIYMHNITNNSHDIFESLQSLFKVIQNGSSAINFENGFIETVFDEVELDYLGKYPLGNDDLILALRHLFYSNENGKYQEIPYQFFTPRQLGEIFESFLEYNLDIAKEETLYFNENWTPPNKVPKKYHDSLATSQKGELIFLPGSEDRKASGAFFTPEHIVDFMIEETLNPLCKDKSTDDILKIRVCDPAMGSGHFLLGTLKYLSNTYR